MMQTVIDLNIKEHNDLVSCINTSKKTGKMAFCLVAKKEQGYPHRNLKQACKNLIRANNTKID